MVNILSYCKDNWWFYVLASIAIILLIASFIVPPTGVIDGSVLAAVGEIFAFASLGSVLKAMDKGIDAKVKNGNTELIVGDFNRHEGHSHMTDEELSEETEF